MEWWKRKTRDYHQKLNVRVASQIAEQFMILRNGELLRLFTRVFIDLMIREFEFVTRGFELVTRGFELVTRGSELVTRGSELVTRGFELALLNFNSCF